jgi:hypothetical protein
MNRTRTPVKLGKGGTGSINKVLAERTSLATTTQAGIVKKAATVANATDAATVITQLNLLLTNLRAAGIIV